MKPEIDPTTDFVFKRLFGDEGRSDLSVSLLNAVVAFVAEGRRVREVTLQSTVQEREHTQDKQTVYDIRLSDQAARRFLVEMQRQGVWYFPKRALYYAASEYRRQLQAGEVYATLQPVFVIGFMVKGWEEASPWHQTFELRERTTGKVLADLEIHLIDLSRFTLKVENLTTALERWCFFLAHAIELDTDKLPATLDVAEIQMAMEVLMRIRENETDFDYYTRQREEEIERASIQHAIKHGREFARKEGLEEGLEEGLKEGLEKGKVIGNIQAFQEFLKHPLTPQKELLEKSEADLVSLLDQLRQQLRANGTGTQQPNP